MALKQNTIVTIACILLAVSYIIFQLNRLDDIDLDVFSILFAALITL